MTSVTSLLETPFLTRDRTQQLRIIELGRPLPFLTLGSLEIVDCNTIVHSFNVDIYKRNNWICGCPNLNAFFCFPCLIFGGDDNWSASGFNNIVHLRNGIQKHELNPLHMSNNLNYSKYVSKPTLSTEKQNERIEKNIQVLEAIIECIKFCACNSIPLLKQQDEDDGDPFEHVLMLITSFNHSLKNYLQQPPFKDLDFIKTDILKAAAEVIREEIIKEIKQAEFVSIIIKSGNSYYPRIIILRYVKGCEPIERVWKIIQYENINPFVDTMLTELQTLLKKPNMLISQSSDHLIVKKQDTLSKLYMKVHNYFPQANLVHFYSHDFLEIISSVATIEKHLLNFCCMVWGICEFMTNESWSPKTRITFEEVRKRFFKETIEKAYDFSNNRIETIYQNSQALHETMTVIIENFQDYPDVVVSKAYSFKHMLEDKYNNYMLNVFFKMVPAFNRCIYEYKNCLKPTYYSDPEIISKIINEDITETQIKPTELNTGSRSSEIQEIQVKDEKDLEIHDIDLTVVKMEIRDNPTEEDISYQPSTSKRKLNEDEEHDTINDKLKEKTINLVQSVMVQLHVLLKYRTNMVASQLVNPQNFSHFSQNFPHHFFTTTVGDLCFFSAFDSMKLRTELGVLYNQHDYRLLLSSCDVLKEIVDNNLTSTFSETVKLLNIVLTFPSMTDDPKRCFKTKYKVQQFLNDSHWLEGAENLVYFRCEKTMVENIKEFSGKVIQKFIDISDQAKHFRRLPLEQ